MVVLTTTGIEIGDKFPSKDYENIHSAICKRKDLNEPTWMEYATAWNAVSYRYYSLVNLNDHFSNLIRHGPSPSCEIRAKQEEVILGFFVTGLSILECLGYATYSIFSIYGNKDFPLSSPKDKRNVSLKKLKPLLEKNFPNQKITAFLRELLSSEEYKKWDSIRNVLMHRGQPSRKHYMGGEKDGLTEWTEGIQINDKTLSTRLEWLESILSEFFDSIYEFVTLQGIEP